MVQEWMPGSRRSNARTHVATAASAHPQNSDGSQPWSAVPARTTPCPRSLVPLARSSAGVRPMISPGSQVAAQGEAALASIYGGGFPSPRRAKPAGEGEGEARGAGRVGGRSRVPEASPLPPLGLTASRLALCARVPDAIGFEAQDGRVIALHLHGTGLAECPKCISRLDALKASVLSGNRISVLPESIGALGKLEYL